MRLKIMVVDSWEEIRKNEVLSVNNNQLRRYGRGKRAAGK